jgi:hypothetical protein
MNGSVAVGLLGLDRLNECLSVQLCVFDRSVDVFGGVPNASGRAECDVWPCGVN